MLALGRLLRSRPRLWASAGLGVLAAGLARPSHFAPLIGWNAFALTYLALAWHMTHGTSHAHVKERAHGQHEGRILVLTLGLAAVAWALFAVAWPLASLHQAGSQTSGQAGGAGGERGLALALSGLTVASSWLFMQVLFALHYAHDFYVHRAQAGQGDAMDFPGTPDPDYGDFLYAACAIGTSGQTADVSFTHSRARRIATVHCVTAFLFNTTALALGVNLAANLL